MPTVIATWALFSHPWKHWKQWQVLEVLGVITLSWLWHTTYWADLLHINSGPHKQRTSIAFHITKHINTMASYVSSLSDHSEHSESWVDLIPSIGEDLGIALTDISLNISIDVSGIQALTDVHSEFCDNDAAYACPPTTNVGDVTRHSPTDNSSDLDTFLRDQEDMCIQSNSDSNLVDLMDIQPVSPSLSFFYDAEDLSSQPPSSFLQDIADAIDSAHIVKASTNSPSSCDSGYFSINGNFQELLQCIEQPPNATWTSTAADSPFLPDLLSAACLATDVPHVMPSVTTTHPETVPPTTATAKVMNKRPGEPYIEMIVKALLSAPDKKMILADIYDHIMTRFPYYCTAPKSWRNAVRHCLSVNEFFVKRGRSTNGSGFYWGLHPACISTFQKGDFRRREARMLARQSEKTRQERVSHVSHAVARFQDISRYNEPLMTSTPARGHYQPSLDNYQSYFTSVATSAQYRY